jgi:hypothetical protein
MNVTKRVSVTLALLMGSMVFGTAMGVREAFDNMRMRAVVHAKGHSRPFRRLVGGPGLIVTEDSFDLQKIGAIGYVLFSTPLTVIWRYLCGTPSRCLFFSLP